MPSDLPISERDLLERLASGVRLADERLRHAQELLQDVRRLCLYMLVVTMVLGAGLAFCFDYMTGSREQIQATREATLAVDREFEEFTINNQAYLDNHARTQRLICEWFRANDEPLPASGDCDDR